MNRHLFASRGTLLALVLLAGAAVVIAFVLDRPVPADRTAEVESLIASFGAELKNVPLLADPATLDVALEEAYGSYVAPELLAAWKADPTTAPGRLVSSPAPERIDIASIARTASGGYQVEANVIETAQEVEVSRYPASVTVEEYAGVLVITGFQKGEYEELPARLEVQGEYECLPHRDQSGPQTMECAFGLEADDGSHYALDFSLLSSDEWMALATGTRIKVEGPYVPDDGTSNYAIEGIIHATSIVPAQ